MPDAQAAVLVSRDLLAGYREFVLEPVTTVVAGPDSQTANARCRA
jgi:hypothetical protein